MNNVTQLLRYSSSIIFLTTLISCGGGSNGSSNKDSTTLIEEKTTTCPAPSPFVPNSPNHHYALFTFSEACSEDIEKVRVYSKGDFCVLRTQQFVSSHSAQKVECTINAKANDLINIMTNTSAPGLLDIAIDVNHTDPTQSILYILEAQPHEKMTLTPYILHQYKVNGTHIASKALTYNIPEDFRKVYSVDQDSYEIASETQNLDAIGSIGYHNAQLIPNNGQLYLLSSAFGSSLFRINADLMVDLGIQLRPAINGLNPYSYQSYLAFDEHQNITIVSDVSHEMKTVLDRLFNLPIKGHSEISDIRHLTLFTQLSSKGELMNRYYAFPSTSAKGLRGIAYKKGLYAIVMNSLDLEASQQLNYLNYDLQINYLDAEANLINSVNLDVSQTDVITSVIQTPKGNISIAGYNGFKRALTNSDLSDPQGFISVFDFEGELILQNIYSDRRASRIRSLDWFNENVALLGASIDGPITHTEPSGQYQRAAIVLYSY